MMPSRDLRGSRRDVALALRDGPKTANEVGKALGRKTGAIFGVIRRMHDEGLLEAAPDPPVRGTRYSLTPRVRELLSDAADASDRAGALHRRQVLLLVEPSDDPLGVAAVLSDPKFVGTVPWAAETAGGWLIAMPAQADSDFPAKRIAARLAATGARTREVHVTDLMTGEELRERSAWLLEDAER